MLVDNPLQAGFSHNPLFDDFLNLDLLNGPSAASSSGSSPRSDSSPSNSFSALPQTPPNPFMFDMGSAVNPLLNFSLDDDFSKLDLPAPLAAPGFDFLSAFTSAAATQMCSPDSGSGSGSSSSLGNSPVSIDPQLVTTPSQPKSVSDFGDDGEMDDEDADLDDPLDGAGNEAQDDDVSIAPVKVGGRGKANRKGTVQSGGVVKRAGGEKKENKASNMLATTSSEADDWRPSPEEYKKMSSKEKRQLRNKISARNFRVRRKGVRLSFSSALSTIRRLIPFSASEYITTLEGDIAERDRLIDAIRTELGSTKSENVALRQEIATLKKTLLEGRGRSDTPILPPPAPLPAIPAAVLASSNANPTTPTQAKSTLPTPNTQKDLPTSPRIGARGFWGGAANTGLGGFGFTPVHTTLVPEWGSVFAGKPLAGATVGRRSPSLQENINPLLNAASPDRAKEQQQQQWGVLESFLDSNPFTMKTLDPYRMQLWRNMAAQQHLRQQQAQQASGASPSPSPLSSPTGLASGLRPHYFAKQAPVLSTLLSGKSAASSYPTPPNSPPLGSSAINATASKSHPMPTPEQAILASMASQTLVRKLGSAFWDAFAARPAGVPANGRRAPQELDAEKVRRIMEGSAVLRVVDVEPQSQTQPAINVAQQASNMRPPQTQTSQAKKCHMNISDILEESMRSLSLGKK
ncbi:uncharacterized protein FIBRA_00036 [Fibroporia radiculosa]|uniref:BZIP domain-containing protein n=1 Tax=Fibroporia radiculosa TaxID=599839 RepID=J7RG11_9APHY|nr:uncharacterized protein FIBRA_00036 [Fibroporia radiculosa]CCL98042.1 predicted protein [Fibroporia radiculosa]